MLAEEEGGEEREVGMRNCNHQLSTMLAPGIPGKGFVPPAHFTVCSYLL